MEKIKSVCMLRDLMLAASDLERQLTERAGIDLTEAMLVCCIAEREVSATEIASTLGMRPSHTSKTLSSLERRALLIRRMGTQDKRRMYFRLSQAGLELLEALRGLELSIPELLLPIYRS